jgi:hypothetical protein
MTRIEPTGRARWATVAGIASIASLGLWIGCEQTGTTPKASATTGGNASDGAGCLDTLPAGFPYKPGCCDYVVDIPAVTESGFHDGKVGASATPVHVHVSWAGPTSSSFVVNWKTDNGTTASELLYGDDESAVKSADGPAGGVKRVTGHHMLYGSVLDANPTRVHEVHVCGLAASKAVFYKVGGKGAWSSTYQVATGPQAGSTEPFRFAVTGDSRNEPSIWAQVQQAISQKGVDFELFSGDFVVIGAAQPEWNGFFEAKTGSFAAQDFLAKTPFMPVNGNHDALSINYVAQFALPQELSPEEKAQGEEWWSFDYGNAHFIGLNDTPDATALGSAQKSWLEADLAKIDRKKTPWVFAMHHRPSYSCGGSHGSDLNLRAQWQPLFDKYKVDMVFTGHDHLYERSKPIRGLMGSDGIVAEAGTNGAPVKESGTVFVVAAGAGAPLYTAKSSCAHTQITESVRNFVIVDIADRKMKYAAYRLDGTTLDQFEYSK